MERNDLIERLSPAEADRRAFEKAYGATSNLPWREGGPIKPADMYIMRQGKMYNTHLLSAAWIGWQLARAADATTIATLSEALAEAEKKGAEDWRPIETAPRDGAPVLLGRFTGQKEAKNEGHICVDWWRRPEDEMGYVGFGFFNPTHWPATHWRPLPAPPSKRAKSQ